MELIAVGVSEPENEDLFDPAFLELDMGERDAYLEAVAESLATALMRAGLVWALMDSETVGEWRARTSRA
jgi:hypothetical protein